MKNRMLVLATFILWSTLSFAREGMWIPTLLNKNISEMQAMGFKLSAQDVYDVNNASLKDAIVHFGGGCTGEIISDKGLLITNHHCGYGQIQNHSSVENDYLTNGFWAMNQGEELPNPGLTVTFLVEMLDVTDQVLAGTDTIETLEAKAYQRSTNIDSIIARSTKDTHFKAKVSSFYDGNQYFLFINEVFTDVRLVGAPPSAIGKFGGDTDNWMWPRHTGDFSLFRVYANADNEPAEYSEDNVPYKPKKFLPINIGGVDKEDFTMVFGYPGRTQQYLPSQAVDLIMNQSDPDKISVRDVKLDIMNKYQAQDPAVRIQYASKNARTSNSWKKWQGEIKGLRRLDAVNKKLDFEKEFDQWVKADEDRQTKYGTILSDFETLYTDLALTQKSYDFYIEAVYRGSDIVSMAQQVNRFLNKTVDTKDRSKLVHDFSDKLDLHFKNYHQPLDEELFVEMMTLYYEHTPTELHPASLEKLMKSNAKQNLLKIYQKSLLTDYTKLSASLSDSSGYKLAKLLKKDKVFQLVADLTEVYYGNIRPVKNMIDLEIADVQKAYMTAILEMQASTKMLFPDANSTLRVSYGKVEGFQPRDGVNYKHYTTLEGIIEKDNPDIYDYDVPDHLKELYAEKDYGQYAMANGQLPICFSASNHTTGGNSGSPVIDAHGALIGINFDRCWEGTMSDIMFDPEKCRNIALDARYALFLIDKFAGAGYLVDEMVLVK